MPALTPNFNWKLPTVGGDVDVWGGYLNDNFSAQDTLIRQFINNFIASSAPSVFQTGTIWLDNTTNPYLLKIYDGTQWVTAGSLDTTSHIFTGSGIAAVTGDYKFSAQTANHNGWLKCDGSGYATATYPELFALIGYSFGGVGVVFALPDLRGRVPGGIGTGTGLTPRTLGDSVGAETHTLIPTELPDPITTLAGTANFSITSGVDGIQSTSGGGLGGQDGVISNLGGDQPHNNMQPSLFVGNFFIYSGA